MENKWINLTKIEENIIQGFRISVSLTYNSPYKTICTRIKKKKINNIRDIGHKTNQEDE